MKKQKTWKGNIEEFGEFGEKNRNLDNREMKKQVWHKKENNHGDRKKDQEENVKIEGGNSWKKRKEKRKIGDIG